MFPEAARAIGEVKPKAFLFENVKGLLRPSFQSYFKYIILRLTYPDFQKKRFETWQEHAKRLSGLDFDSYGGTKYRVCYRLVNAADYGVPQVRERVIIVGFRSHNARQIVQLQLLIGSLWHKALYDVYEAVNHTFLSFLYTSL